MVNMKISREEAKEYSQAVAVESSAPEYPYGLGISLDDDSLSKLGVTEPPAVGTKLRITALVVVTSTSMRQEQDGDKESRCELQITDMEMAGESGKDAATVLYGS